MARLDLYLLGALEIVLNDTPVTDRLHRKARALLAYLAIEAGRSHQRNALTGRYPL
jgi:DNA-binding SARP family transcriptional activator